MLLEALDALGPDDVLVLDRGYPAGWLVALLNERGIRFCMRCDKANGWVAMRALPRSGEDEMRVTLRAPGHQDALDYECSGRPPMVRWCVGARGLSQRFGASGRHRLARRKLRAH